MIVFTGFPYTKVIDSELKADFTIELIQDNSISYKKELNNKVDNKDLLDTIREIRAFLNFNRKDKDMFLSNLVEFLIWFDKKSDSQYFEIYQMIYECVDFSRKIDFVQFLINHKDDVEKFKLNNLINEVFDDELYCDPNLITSLRQLCWIYNINFKEKMIYVLKRYVNDKVLKIVEDNFDDLVDEDLFHAILYTKNVDLIKEEYKRLCIIKDIVDVLINGENNE